ncbi:TetR/AcrR family transcriptional regulator, partial [Streptomyces sp. NPDC039028]|uniref:TetR/AcrR family transcriptional regulator n=1 Tax=Streptomyces sp. NPDC039028 TaxID=3155370 RepID=UPI0033E7768D
MSTARARILEATEELLATKDALSISTRAICDRAKVGMPEIYRQFGDKQGLLTAVADVGFARFLAEKRRNPLTDDPVEDLRTAWDSHVAFALRNPHLYRLMFTPAGDAKPGAVKEAQAILLQAVERCRDAGRLRTSPELAGRSILSANVGVCMMALSFPDLFGDSDTSPAGRPRPRRGSPVPQGSPGPRSFRRSRESRGLPSSRGAPLPAGPRRRARPPGRARRRWSPRRRSPPGGRKVLNAT